MVVSVLPAPDSPETRMDWRAPAVTPRYASAATPNGCGGSASRLSSPAGAQPRRYASRRPSVYSAGSGFHGLTAMRQREATEF